MTEGKLLVKIFWCREGDDEDEHGIVVMVQPVLREGGSPTRLGLKAIRLAEDEFGTWLGNRWSDPPRIIRDQQLFLPGHSGVEARGRLVVAMHTHYGQVTRPAFVTKVNHLVVDYPHTFTSDDLLRIAKHNAVRAVRYVDEVAMRRKRVALFWNECGRQQALDALNRVMQ